ncbi:MAG: hypothetical protein WD398_08505 [Cyclobacteriaceae bacterium]
MLAFNELYKIIGRNRLQFSSYKTSNLSFSSLAIAGLLIWSFQSDYPPPFPRNGISKVYENDRIVVWQGILGVKGEPTPMHHHQRDLVGVFLDDGQVRNKLPDGTMRVGNLFSRGSVVFQPKGVVHTEEVLMDGTRAVGIEPKSINAGDSQNLMQETSSCESDGRVIIDNNRVVIREYVWPAGREIVRHTGGRDVVIVPLESGRVCQSHHDGSSSIERLVFGQVIVKVGDQTYQEEVASGSPRAIIVEIR